MKQTLFSTVVVLTVAAGLQWAARAQAQDPPRQSTSKRAFEDVPRADWTYSALTKLGNLYGIYIPYLLHDTAFSFPVRTLTRYEFALEVEHYAAILSDKEDLKTKDILEALKKEFGPEIEDASNVLPISQPTPSLSTLTAIPRSLGSRPFLHSRPGQKYVRSTSKLFN